MKISLVFLTVLMTAQMTIAHAGVTECDRLAANPDDPDRVAEGVPDSRVDIKAAIIACTRSLEADPENPRLAYQLGRVSFYDGNTPNALKYIGQAAEQGYRQAEFVMGALGDNRREGVPADSCLVEDYWYRAATKGHLNAQVAYVRNVTKGLFDNCVIQASDTELAELIDVGNAGAENYPLLLLVKDLKEDVAARAARDQK